MRTRSHLVHVPAVSIWCSKPLQSGLLWLLLGRLLLTLPTSNQMSSCGFLLVVAALNTSFHSANSAFDSARRRRVLPSGRTTTRQLLCSTFASSPFSFASFL